jgi:predicted ribosome quality control (RQC) complex YloA/Tae2 family protein
VHNNFYFLRQLSASLDLTLKGTVISECFSQNKDELIIRFETQTKPFFIKASLISSFANLSFPDAFQRARKNSVNLFDEMIGRRIIGVRQYDNERSFSLILNENKVLLFKMHGNRSNIVLFIDDVPRVLFKGNMTADQHIDLRKIDREIDWSFDAFKKHSPAPEKLYFTFGKVVWKYLETRHYGSLSAEEKWKLILMTDAELREPSFYLTSLNGTVHLTLLRFDNSRLISRDPINASNEFFYAYTHESGLERERSRLLSFLKNRLSGSETYYEKNFARLAETESDNNYKIRADLIMANLHNIRQGMEHIVLPDFYHEGRMVDIPLRKELSPQANAALLYRKARNQHIEIERLQESLRLKQNQIRELRQLISEVEGISDLKALREKSTAITAQNIREEKAVSMPYHEFLFNGFRIWVGKGAMQNDVLTQRLAYKEDLWLHAKDVSGSHVLIKHQPGRSFPKDVIERAAELAAYNSKRRTENLCPVIVTPKKFVRKRKGDPAGAVVVEREEVILVQPKLA